MLLLLSISDLSLTPPPPTLPAPGVPGPGVSWIRFLHRYSISKKYLNIYLRTPKADYSHRDRTKLLAHGLYEFTSDLECAWGSFFVQVEHCRVVTVFPLVAF